MRIVKDPVERRNEILDAAEILFTSKGYMETTILDILKAVNIAKGTFYYYFTSKEEVLDAILVRMIQRDVEKMQLVLQDSALEPVQKIGAMLMAQQAQPGDIKYQLNEIFHKPGNGDMHLKYNVLALQHISPLLGTAVKEGIQQGVFHLEHPMETCEFLLGASVFAFDEGLGQWSREELQTRARAFTNLMESALGAAKGSFAYIGAMLDQM